MKKQKPLPAVLPPLWHCPVCKTIYSTLLRECARCKCVEAEKIEAEREEQGNA